MQIGVNGRWLDRGADSTHEDIMSLDAHYRRQRHERLNMNLTKCLQPEAEMIFIDSAVLLTIK